MEPFKKSAEIAAGWFNLVRQELGFLPPALQRRSDERMKICSACEFRNDNQCMKCTCHIPAKILSDSQCPQGFWK